MPIQSTLALLRKQFGDDSVKLGSEVGDSLAIKHISTGCTTLDILLRGGAPLGRMMELYGPETSAKTTMAIHTAMQFLSSPLFSTKKPENVYVVWLDMEGTLTKDYLERLGLPADRYILISPDTGESIFDALWKTVNEAQDDHILWIVDSLAVLARTSELEESVDDYMLVGSGARLNTDGIRRKVLPALRKSRFAKVPRLTVLHLNQARDVMNSRFRSIDSPGGHMRKHINSVAVEMKAGKAIAKSVQRNKIAVDEEYGFEIRFRILKNKCGGPEHVSATTTFWKKDHTDRDGRQHRGGTFDNETALLSAALFYGGLRLDKRTYFFEDAKVATSEQEIWERLAQDPVFFQKVYNSTLVKARESDWRAVAGTAQAEEGVNKFFDKFGNEEGQGEEDEEPVRSGKARKRGRPPVRQHSVGAK